MVLQTIYTHASSAPGDNAASTDLDPAMAQVSLADQPALSLHPLPREDGLIVKIEPPKAPPATASGLKRTPCDIVLVIDVSGSMGANAPAPTNDNESGQEDFGLSVLDLTKHAANTILETLDDGDRLGLVTYSTDAYVLQELVVMNEENKAKTRENINSLRPLDSTNMWHGILKGLDLFRNVQKPDEPVARVPAMMLLTDGMPNYMCPPQGYIPKLRTMEALPAHIHTFGFGYYLESELLKSLSEFGGGTHSFIPDAGMIGTAFVHAVANLQATYAHEATLVLKYPNHLTVTETTGKTVVKTEPFPVDPSHSATKISLGPVIYGQSRDVYLKVESKDSQPVSNADIEITAELIYSRVGAQPAKKVATASYKETTETLSIAEIGYHKSRSELCAFMSKLFGGVAWTDGVPKEYHQELEALIAAVKARQHGDPLNQSILEDLCGDNPKGQISLAISKDDYWTKWGHHYIPSLLSAHWRQACNSFKDPGPLQYGSNSPLFIQCRDRLDAAFDTIAPPEPSNRGRDKNYFSGPIQMSRWNNAHAPCFAGSTLVKLSSGRSVPIRSLRRGAEILSPLGPRKVAAVLVTPVNREILCRVGDLVVTPWHPVSTDGKTWSFPAQIADSAVRYTGCVYSILLQPDRISTSHAVHVGGVWGVTLGHGILSGRDVRAHPFFGDFNAVVKSLRYVGVRRNGLAVGGGIRRDEKTGLVSGFRRGTGRVPGSMQDIKASSRRVEA